MLDTGCQEIEHPESKIQYQVSSIELAMIAIHDRIYAENFIGEKFVSHIWDGGHFAKDSLRSKDGRKIEVLYQGKWNDDSGADFHDAEVKIDGQIQKGDVEVHVRGSDWRVHHHDVDPKYNNTILHVVMWDDSFNLLTRKQNGEHIPTIVLYDYLDSSIGKLWKRIEEEKKPLLLPCREKAEGMAHGNLGAILDRAGMDRFLLKAKLLEERLQESSELLYERIMEALGYSKNRKQFLELARRIPLELLVGRSPEEIQAVFFGVAGFIPHQSRTESDEETEEYISRIEKLWEPFSLEFKDGRILGQQWEFSGIRPRNFPTRRIAGMSYILSSCDPAGSLIDVFLKVFNHVELADHPYKMSRRLRNILMPQASGYWTRHYTFGGKQHEKSPYLIGQNRAADIIINVVLPVTLAHARKSQNRELQQIVTKVYANHQRLQDNKITREVAGRIFRDEKESVSVVKSAMRQQGLIHLYKSFCAVRNCQVCPVIVSG